MSLSVIIAVVEKDGADKCRLLRLDTQNRSSRNPVLQVELLSKNIKRKESPNPYLRVGDCNVETITCTTKFGEHRLIGATRCCSLVKAYARRWNIRENYAGLLVAVIAIAKANNNPCKAKQKEPDEVVL